MNARIAVAALVAAALAGCASASMNRAVLRERAERNCRVQAAVSPAYAIDSTGIGMRSIAYVRCLHAAGFEA